MKTIVRCATSENAVETIEPKNRNDVNTRYTTGCPLSRKQQNMLRKTDIYKVSILLHPSLVFIKSSLYVNSSLKKASSVLETNFLQPLVDDGFLIAVPNGLVNRKSKTTVYIRMIPNTDEASKEAFINRLKSFVDHRLNYDTYLASCRDILFHSTGVISEEVLEILQLERYQILNIDMSSLVQQASHEDQCETLNDICSISTRENVPICNENSVANDKENCSIHRPQVAESMTHHDLNVSRLVEIFPEIDNGSNSSMSELIVTNEEIVEQQPETTNTGNIVVNRNPETKRKETNYGELGAQELSPRETSSETIAKRVRSRQRKRTKTSVT